MTAPSLIDVEAACLTSGDAASFTLGSRGNLHTRLALSVTDDVCRVSSVVTSRAHVTSPPSTLAGTGAVLALPGLGAGCDDDELLLADSADAFDSSCQLPVLADDVDLAREHLAGPTAVAAVTTRHEVADVVVPAVVVKMVNAQFSPSNTSVSHSPRYVFPAPVAWVRSRSDDVVENHAVFRQQSVGGCQGVVWSIDVSVPSARHSEEWYQSCR